MTSLTSYVDKELSALANPARAAEMAAYMRTDMPFYGVQKPDRLPIIKAFKSDYKPLDQASYLANVRALWDMPRRECKYLAINYAVSFKKYIDADAVPLYEAMVREGQWWDFVDPIAADLIGRVLLDDEEALRPLIESYVVDEDFWIRRVALLAHLKHKKATGPEAFEYCLRLAGEREFFIRKAIGWLLREYSKSEPALVAAFLRKNQDRLSPLSYREGAKHLWKIEYPDLPPR